jgi:hypothetical protein
MVGRRSLDAQRAGTPGEDPATYTADENVGLTTNKRNEGEKKGGMKMENSQLTTSEEQCFQSLSQLAGFLSLIANRDALRAALKRVIENLDDIAAAAKARAAAMTKEN